MALFALPQITLRCEAIDLRKQLIPLLEKQFHLKQTEGSGQRYSLKIDGRAYSLSLLYDNDDNGIVIWFSNDEMTGVPDSASPTIFVHVGSAGAPRVDGSVAYFACETLSMSSLRSIMAYAAMLNDCFPFGLHGRGEMTPLVRDCLRRVFRGIDLDIDGRVSFSEISEYNRGVFGNPLSTEDQVAMFVVINGAPPCYNDRLSGCMVTFFEFELVMQHMISRGHGHTIFRLIEAAPFRHYVEPKAVVVFKGCERRDIGEETLKLVSKFVVLLHEQYQDDYNSRPRHEHICQMFQIQGGVPGRLRNVNDLSMSEWVRIWREWCIVEPAEAARNLVALGFPLVHATEAFGVSDESQGVSGAMTAIGTVAAVAGVIALFMKRRL